MDQCFERLIGTIILGIVKSNQFLGSTCVQIHNMFISHRLQAVLFCFFARKIARMFTKSFQRVSRSSCIIFIYTLLLWDCVLKAQGYGWNVFINVYYNQICLIDSSYLWTLINATYQMWILMITMPLLDSIFLLLTCSSTVLIVDEVRDMSSTSSLLISSPFVIIFSPSPPPSSSTPTSLSSSSSPPPSSSPQSPSSCHRNRRRYRRRRHHHQSQCNIAIVIFRLVIKIVQTETRELDQYSCFNF